MQLSGKGMQRDGLYITQANEPAGGQDVFHIHFHIYPRWDDESKNKVELTNDIEREKTMGKVKSAFE